MTPSKLDFPALYSSADTASAEAQRGFWRTIKAEYVLLFLVACLSLGRGIFGPSLIILNLLLMVLAGLFVYKVHKKLDQDWYRCRALAESVKTSTWRFAMRAHPFQDADNIDVPKAELRNLIRDILRANTHLAEKLEHSESDEALFKETMLAARKMPLEDRLAFYVKHRIDDQKGWYAKKVKENKEGLTFWFRATIGAYVLAGISLNSTQLGFGWASYAFDPLIVVVTSAIGWLQMKRHSELMASYNLTAHEIGIIKSNSGSVKTEGDLSEFVNEAELAFSREHTQWVARRDAV